MDGMEDRFAGFTDTFDAASTVTGWLTSAGMNASWKPLRQPKPGEGVKIECLTCGHVVTLSEGESIPYGDPRLCEHAGRKP
jgi:hypothetical protein